MTTLGRDTKVTWFGHGTFLYETPGGKRIMIDAWVYDNPACPDNLKAVDNLDAILITHGHFDHLVGVVELVRATRPKQVVGIFEIENWLGRQGVENTVGMNKGGTVDVQGVKATMLQAIHSSGITGDDGSIVYGGEAASYLLEMENGLRVYQAGDTAIFGDMKLYGELFRPEVAVLPIGDHFTMDPFQAAYAAELLGVKYVIPSHYGTFPILTGTPQKLREELAKRGYECHVFELQPGDTVS